MSIRNRVKKLHEQLKADKPRIRVTFNLSTGLIQWPSDEPAKKEKQAETPYKAVRLAPTDVSTLTPGCTCPKCNGSGRYKWHDDHSRVEACFWCTDSPKEASGKGFLNEKNIRYIRKHVRQDTVYWIHSA